MQVGVFGAGSFGSALAQSVASNNIDVRMWARSPEQVEEINSKSTNSKYVKDLTLHPRISATTSFEEVCKNSEVWIYACPSHYIEEFFSSCARTVEPKDLIRKVLVNTAKGIDPKSLRLHHQIAEDILGKAFVRESFLCLSGPSFAAEMLKGSPTCLTLSGFEWRKVMDLQKILGHSHFRLYTNADVIGCELGGAMKNVIAIGAGAVDGLALGHNTLAALINLGLGEIARLGTLLGARAETFLGLSGMGDLVLTCTSSLSRNRTFGYLLGQGLSVEAAKKEAGSTVEGYSAAMAVHQLVQKYQVRAPICETVYQILHLGKSTRESIDRLLSIEPGTEWI